MGILLYADREVELVFKEKAMCSLNELSIQLVAVEAMIERNPEVILNATEHEPIVVSEFISLVLYKENNQLVVNNVYGMESIVEQSQDL